MTIRKIGKKSINMSDIMVYLAMFSITNLMLLGPHNMKMIKFLNLVIHIDFVE